MQQSFSNVHSKVPEIVVKRPYFTVTKVPKMIQAGLL